MDPVLGFFVQGNHCIPCVQLSRSIGGTNYIRLTASSGLFQADECLWVPDSMFVEDKHMLARVAVNDIIELKGITRKGKSRITTWGNLWNVVQVRKTANTFFPQASEEHPCVMVTSRKTIKGEQDTRWLHDDFKDFVVVQILGNFVKVD